MNMQGSDLVRLSSIGSIKCIHYWSPEGRKNCAASHVAPTNLHLSKEILAFLSRQTTCHKTWERTKGHERQIKQCSSKGWGVCWCELAGSASDHQSTFGYPARA